MHQLLEEAFDRASSLPRSDLETLARRVLNADACWDDLFARPEPDDILTARRSRCGRVNVTGGAQPYDATYG